MNLTDNEREKFLERCVNDDHCGDCPLEYLSDECMEYRSNLLSLALDLINRKQAVNKLQAKQIVKLKIKVEQQKVEIERLWEVLENRGEICKSCDEKYTEKIKRAKTEAIKEFAERLKKIAIEKGSVPIVFVDIDNLVKEMVGDNNG